MVLKKRAKVQKRRIGRRLFFHFLLTATSPYILLFTIQFMTLGFKKNVSLQRKMAKKQQGGRYFQSFKHTSQPINPKSILNQPYIKSISTLYHLYGTVSVLLVYCRCTADVPLGFLCYSPVLRFSEQRNEAQPVDKLLIKCFLGSLFFRTFARIKTDRCRALGSACAETVKTYT